MHLNYLASFGSLLAGLGILEGESEEEDQEDSHGGSAGSDQRLEGFQLEGDEEDDAKAPRIPELDL